jgi:hypothetical protein
MQQLIVGNIGRLSRVININELCKCLINGNRCPDTNMFLTIHKTLLMLDMVHASCVCSSWLNKDTKCLVTVQQITVLWTLKIFRSAHFGIHRQKIWHDIRVCKVVKTNCAENIEELLHISTFSRTIPSPHSQKLSNSVQHTYDITFHSTWQSQADIWSNNLYLSILQYCFQVLDCNWSLTILSHDVLESKLCLDFYVIFKNNQKHLIVQLGWDFHVTAVKYCFLKASTCTLYLPYVFLYLRTDHLNYRCCRSINKMHWKRAKLEKIIDFLIDNRSVIKSVILEKYCIIRSVDIYILTLDDSFMNMEKWICSIIK